MFQHQSRFSLLHTLYINIYVAGYKMLYMTLPILTFSQFRQWFKQARMRHGAIRKILGTCAEENPADLRILFRACDQMPSVSNIEMILNVEVPKKD